MAARAVNPWASLRALSIRTRASLRPLPSCAEQQQTMARRAMSSSTTSEPPADGSRGNGAAAPPPPPPGMAVSPYHELFVPNFLNTEAITKLEQAAAEAAAAAETEGLIFHKPTRPQKHEQLQDRYHPVIHQVTRLLMRDGKLSQAQRNMTLILNNLRTSPPPKINPLRPLLPGAPPAALLPLNPLLYLTLAVESVAPLVRVSYMKGQAGGGHALEVPIPLNARSRRRIAMGWILEVVDKKKSRGSGKGQFAARFSEEIIAVVEGRSPVWDRRQTLHKQSTVNRANLNHNAVRGK